MEDQKPAAVVSDVLQEETFDTNNPVQIFASPLPALCQRRFWHKIGIYALYVLVLGTATMLLALGLVTFLWTGVNATTVYNRSTTAFLWRTIITKAWISQAITILSLVIRLSITSQAGVCTSMLAALLLECSGVPIPWAAEVSLIRSITTGPHHLALAVLEAFPRIRGPVVIPVLFTMALTTLLSQFCSTLLLSDLKPGKIITGAIVSPIPYGYHPNSDLRRKNDEVNVWAVQPRFYPAFAEYSEPGEHTNNSIYTGKVFRAMLPFSDSLQRSLVHSYTGLAIVAYLQTTCIRPNIQAKVESHGIDAPTLIGKVSGSPSRQLINDNISFGPINDYFNCTIPITSSMNDPRSYQEWKTSICRVAAGRGAYLFLNVTKGDWYSQDNLTTRSLHEVNYDYSDGVWQNMISPTAALGLSASLCWIQDATELIYVDISSNVPRTEPTLGWNSTKSYYNSEAIRTQLGTTTGANKEQLTIQERNILSLNINRNRPVKVSDMYAGIVYGMGNPMGANVTAKMCNFCSDNDIYKKDKASFTVHRAQVAVFQDILTSTSNPALALQAQYFTLRQMQYYDIQQEMDDTSSATVSFFVEALMPMGWNGYISVVVVLIVHLICTILSVGLYLTRTRYTLLGNTWSAVGQTIKSGTASATIAATAAMKTDSEIRKRIGRDPDLFILRD